MTLYELTKTYGSGKGEGMMWKSVEMISEAVEKYMPEQAKHDLKRKMYGEMSGGHYNETFAEEDIKKMYYTDKSGAKHEAPYWPTSAVREIYESVKGKIKPYNCWDFLVTMNMSKADNCNLLSEWFPNDSEEQRNERIVQMAINFLNDPDNPYSEHKIWGYLNSD